MAETNNTPVNILFKRGTQAALNNMQTSVNGTFYLTTDTNRLYIGNGTAAPALLNQTVQIVPNVASLPGEGKRHINDFYYCTAENILAVYNGNEWKQINPDTNDNDTIKVTDVIVGDGVVTEDESVTYNVALTQKKYNKSGQEVNGGSSTVNFALTLTKEDLEAIIHDPANVGLKVTSGTNAATVATQGTGANTSQTAVIKGGSNVTVSASDSEITVAANDSRYGLKALNNSGEATVRLEGKGDAGGVNYDVKFNAGKHLNVSATNSETITYSHASIDTTRTKVNSDAPPVLSPGQTIDVIGRINTDNGHVTEIITGVFRLPDDTSIKQINSVGDTDWQNEIEETDGKKFTIDFSTDAAKLKTDLEKQITDGLAAANTALTYKGGISSYSALELKTNVEVGDVYLLTSPDQTYKTGDLFIAVAGEGATVTNGVISGAVEWTHVPSGDELNTDTLFKGDVTVTTGGEGTGNVKYAWSASRGADNDGKTPAMPEGHEDLNIKAGKDIVVGGSDTEATIGHKEYAAVTPNNSAAGSAASFTAVTGVTLSNGHVTGVNTQTYTPDTYTLAGTSNQIQLKKGTGALVKAIPVEGDSWIDAKVTNDKVTLTHATPQTTGGTTKSVTNNGTLTHGGKLNILTGVTYDAKGHVSDVTTGEVTLPADNNTTYDMFVGGSTSASSSVSAATVNPYVVLRNSSGQNDTIRLKGDSGSLAVSGNAGEVTISMVWGSF